MHSQCLANQIKSSIKRIHTSSTFLLFTFFFFYTILMGNPAGNRKKAFSAKQKRAQLQAKRARKRNDSPEDAATPVPPQNTSNRLASQFDKLTRPEIETNKKLSMLSLRRLPPQEGLLMSFDDTHRDISIPLRPAWQYTESKEKIEHREERYFQDWLEQMGEFNKEEVSLYERNLEVWRQLWRVVEVSDLLVVVVDIRHPALHFPPSLYRYVTETVGKPMVVALNKTDLVSKDTVKAWARYFQQKFPAVTLTTFCCYKNEQDLLDDTRAHELKMASKRPRRRVYDRSMAGQLFEACRKVLDEDKRQLVDWDSLIARYATNPEDIEEEKEAESGAAKQYVTLGLIGHPNVGKSTVINSILGRTVVSTSRTPGHTKHFQTIHVTPNLRLCDCPGLVFPCAIPRNMQILAGLYNIAQVQEPYTCVQYLAERVPLEQILRLRGEDKEWSAWSICEAHAVDRGYFTSRAARPDVYRAALSLLRWELDGRILLSFKPPGFFDDFEYLREHEEPSVIQETSDNEQDTEPLVAQQSRYAVLLDDENI